MRAGRKSIRLKNYDYTQPGAYFVTLCTQGRACLLGKVTGAEIVLAEYGKIVGSVWAWLQKRYRHVVLDEWIVMPNHLHAILILRENAAPGEDGSSSCRGGSRAAPTKRAAPTAGRKSLGQIVGAFKTVSTKRINEIRGTPGYPLWQRNYYEHVIRNEHELGRIREYIVSNPLRWSLDRENPASTRDQARLEMLHEPRLREIGRIFSGVLP